jgi:O-antigen ligase
LGEPLAIAIPLFTTLALTLRRRRAALFCGAAALIAWLAVIQMLERAPFIATSVALIVIAVSSALVPQCRSRSLLRAVLLGASFFIVFAFETNLISLKQETTQAASRTVVARLQTTGVSDDSTNVRFLFWAVGWQMWRAHPLAGVGANNYDVAFPESRKAFAEKYPNSPLIDLNADLIAQRAHNEYVQILAELGLIGFALFAAFCVALMYCAAKAVCYARNPLALGATGSLIVFALSSGASSVSFRWDGSGLMFFFAAAIVARMASLSAPQTASTVKLAPPLLKATNFAVLALALLVSAGMSAQALNITLHGAAQASSDSQETERRYRAALFWNPFDAATHYNFGLLLYFNNRAKEAVPHLRYAAQRGFNSSICYEYLAGAEIGAGDAASAEQTLDYAVKVYPRSVFLRARHGAMLAALNKPTEAASEYAAAESINLRLARGWQQLINYGVDAATQAANRDTNISRPGELLPEEGVFAVLAEDNQRCCLSANFLHQQSIAVSR